MLEYITGTVMENLFGVRYWDYTDKKFNFRGRICLEATSSVGLFYPCHGGSDSAAGGAHGDDDQ